MVFECAFDVSSQFAWELPKITPGTHEVYVPCSQICIFHGSSVCVPACVPEIGWLAAALTHSQLLGKNHIFPLYNRVQSPSEGLGSKMLLKCAAVGLNCLFHSIKQNKQLAFPSSYTSNSPAAASSCLSVI